LFLGLERIKALAIASVIARLITAIPIFLFVHSPRDVTIAVFLSAANNLLTGAALCLLIVTWRLVGKFTMPTRAEIIEVYKVARPLFASSVAVSLYSTTNVVILGIVQDSYQVGIFNAADKLRSAAMIPITAISGVYFPRVSRLSDQRSMAIDMLVSVAMMLTGIMMIVTVGLFVGAPMLVHFIAGGAFDGSVAVLRILAVVPLLVGVGTVLGPLAMVNMGMTKQCSRIVVTSGLVNLILMVPLASRFGGSGTAASLVITETVVAGWMAWTLYREGILKEATAVLVGKLRSIWRM
jgi:O-antigen/teichoic acid export membrane protein